MKNGALDMRRSFYLVAYDVRDDQRLARIYAVVYALSCGGQKSAFECWLSASEKHQLLTALATLKAPEDAVVLIRLTADQAVMRLGVAPALPTESMYWG
jgi:CRISPR-associated protein Cas2